MSEPAPERYSAFISYSHSDEAIAAWLQRALERYRVPKHLVGTDGRSGTVPARFNRVFRDRDELPSGTDLRAEISEALQLSSSLIVICSPAAAQSTWVNEEIATYKRLRGDDRIYCIIVAGEPGISSNVERANEECFPPAVRFKLTKAGELSDTPISAEPIAADLRPGMDGREIAKLKIIAGLLGVGLDDLRRREQQRRYQRMTIIAVSAIAGLVVATILAGTAYLARLEAVAQRSLAEEEAETAEQTTRFLIDLFEISNPSEARGNSVTARELLDKGSAQIESSLSTRPQVSARLKQVMGDVYMSLGLYSEAEPLLESALMQRTEFNGESSLEAANVLRSLSAVSRWRGEYEDMEVRSREVLDIRRDHLGNDHPDVLESLGNLGMALSYQGRFVEAESLQRQTLQSLRKLSDVDTQAYVRVLSNLATSVSSQGRNEEAEPIYRDALQIAQDGLGSDHPQVAVLLSALGLCLRSQDKHDEAASLLRNSVVLSEKLWGENDEQVSISLTNLSLVYNDQGDYAKSEAISRRALDIDLNNHGINHPYTAGSMFNLGFVLERLGRNAEAEEAFAAALAARRTILDEDHPDIAESLRLLGLVHLAQKRWAEAESEFREALRILTSRFDDEAPQVIRIREHLAELESAEKS